MRLKELRESSSLSQRELGDRVGLSKSSIGNYESGQRQPDMDTLNLLANYFHVTVDYLMGRSDIPTFDISSEEEQMIRFFRKVQKGKRRLLIELFESLIHE